VRKSGIVYQYRRPPVEYTPAGCVDDIVSNANKDWNN
jgi:hypothetical protein